MLGRKQVARTATNELGPARDNCGHGYLSLINKIKAIYLTGSFLIARMKVRYSTNHYLLLLLELGDINTIISFKLHDIIKYHNIAIMQFVVQM